MADEKAVMLFRVALVGDSGTGKTAILLRYADNVFHVNTQFTIGVEWKFKTMQYNGDTIKLQIWDTAGQERFSSLAPLYCRKADAVLLFYDTTRVDTFQHVEYWSHMIDVPPKCEFVLVGNKIDMEESRQVTKEMGAYKAKELREGMKFFETSAKENINIDAMFDHLVPLLVEKKSKKNPNVGTIKLHHTKAEVKPEKEGCCQGKS